MNSRDFCFWLQGYFELEQSALASSPTGKPGLTPASTEKIRQHLAMVFLHEIDPQINAKDPDGGKALDAAHKGKVDSGVMRC